jgi:hypothetical protein
MGNALHVIRALPYSNERPGGPIALELVESEIVRAGVAYWKRCAAGRKYPDRGDISPREIRGLLRNVVLLRVIDSGRDYEYRIVGDAHVIAHGFSMQGKNLSRMDDHAPGYGAILKQLYDYPVRRGTPLALRGWLSMGEEGAEFVFSESVFLPLGPDDETVDHVLNFSVYAMHPAKTLEAASA